MGIFRTLVCTAVTALAASTATAQVVTEWTFNSVPADASTATGTLVPATGAGTVTGLGAITGVTPAVFAAGTVTDTTSAGDNSALQTSAYPALSVGSGTAGVRFDTSTAGASNINVSFEQRHSNTASRFFRFEYTTDGANFVTTGLPSDGVYSITVGSAFTAFNFDLSGIPAVSNNPNFGFRVVSIFDPATNTAYAATNSTSTYGTTGTVRFDLVRVVQGAPPIGACCVNGFCVGDLTEAACLANGTGSSWGGAGTACASFPCPAPTGACCIALACTTTTQAECTGTWSVNTACTPTNPCDPAQACCFTNGSCLLRPTADCATLGGTPNGAGTTCTAGMNTCPPPPSGACCTGASCAVAADPIACAGTGGQFRGINTTCTPNPCFVAGGSVIATYDFDTNIVGTPATNLSFTPAPDLSSTNGTFTSVFDVFGVTDRTVNSDFADDSVTNTADTFGILRAAQTGRVFGVEDLLNNDNASGAGTATWTFNVAGFNNLNISIDFAAMGNFEALGTGGGSVGDVFSFGVSIDGGAPVNVFVSNIYEGLTPTYTLESGTLVTNLPDPAAINGTLVLNQFVNIAAPIAGSGNTLTLTFNATSDGGSEVFLFDNIVIRGTPVGGATGACCSGATCSVIAQAACTGANTAYRGDGTACNAPGNSTTPCCKADYNQVGGVTVQDIFDFLAGYFSNNLQADINASGTVTVQDIFDFLAVYFAGCA